MRPGQRRRARRTHDAPLAPQLTYWLTYWLT